MYARRGHTHRDTRKSSEMTGTVDSKSAKGPDELGPAQTKLFPTLTHAMVIQCGDCKKNNFKTQRGLAVHRATCKVGRDEPLSQDRDRQTAAAVANAFKKARKKGLQRASLLKQRIHPGPLASAAISTAIDIPLSSESDPHLSSAPDPEPEASRSRSGRLRTFPSRYRDFLPAQTIPLAHAPQPAPRHHSEPPCDDTAPLGYSPEPEPTVFTTRINDAGLFRVYPIKPTSDPDSIIGLDDVCESSHFQVAAGTLGPDHNPLLANGILPEPKEQDFYAPFTCPSIYRLMRWFFSGSQAKSLADLDNLITDVITATDFNARDFVGVSAVKEARRLDKYQGSPVVSPSTTTAFLPSHGWTESNVPISLPCERRNLVNESKAPMFPVSGLFHRDIVDIVITAFRDPEIFPTLHLTPYKEYRVLEGGNPPERVYSEMYSSDAFSDAWESVQNQTHIAEDGLERVMVALMLWSDSTCLTNFGSASLWPVYLSLGNQSKYVRTKPSSFAHHHLAYMPSVSQVYSILIL